MKNYHALLYFDTEINLGLGTHPDVWTNYKTVEYTDGKKAFEDFVTELKYNKVFLVSGESLDELEEAKQRVTKCFNDPEWRAKLFSNPE